MAVEPGHKRLHAVNLTFVVMFFGAALTTCAATPSQLLMPEAVDQVYADRDREAIWMAGPFATPLALTLLDYLASAGADGMDPEAYHLTELIQLLDQTSPSTESILISPGESQRAEILLTDAFLALGRDLTLGRIDPSTLWEKWSPPGDRPDPGPQLMRILVNIPGSAKERPAGTADLVVSALDSCRPGQREYRELRSAMKGLVDIALDGGWPTVTEGELLRPGDHTERVSQLRKRLAAGGDLVQLPLVFGAGLCVMGDPYLYDDFLASALCAFQKRHGLTADGIVGPRTLAALNVSAAQRAVQAALNLERWRWLPHDSGPRRIYVNIPDFSLSLNLGNGTPPLTMRAIVGRKDRPTPVLSGEMKWLVLNPRWTVPQKLARKDLLPKITADPDYLVDRGFRVFKDWRPGAVEIDPAVIDWTAMVPENLPFKFQQQPGPRNPLGRMKFLFPNPYCVYIHDTNHRAMFDRERRCFSSRCVRIENPEALLTELIANQKTSRDSTALTALAAGETVSLGLDEPLPVQFVYLTAWVDGKGILQFRDDCYGYDETLAANVSCTPLTPVPSLQPMGRTVPLAVAVNVSASTPSSDIGTYQVRTGPVSRWTKPEAE